jgi:hypothetical protein
MTWNYMRTSVDNSNGKFSENKLGIYEIALQENVYPMLAPPPPKHTQRQTGPRDHTTEN